MQNEKEYLINEIQLNCRIKSPSRSPSPFKKREKFFQELNQRSKSDCDNYRPKRKRKVIEQDQNSRNNYYKSILSLPFNDPRPLQEMISILMKNPQMRQEVEILFLTQILCQYSFFSKIKQQYGVEIIQTLSSLSHYKKYDSQQKIDFFEKTNIGQSDNSEQNQAIQEEKKEEEIEQNFVILILISGTTILSKISEQKQEKMMCQQGYSLQLLNNTDLMVDQSDFSLKLKEYQYQTQSPSSFIVIPLNEYHSILYRNMIRLQKIKQIEKAISNREDEPVKQYKFLQQIPIFKRFSDADIYDIMANMTLQRLCHGQTLFKQGDTIKGVYIIYHGEFQIMKKQDRLNQVIQYEALQGFKDINKFIPNMDQSLVVSVIRAGEIFGFEEIIQNQQFRQYTVEAMAINTFVFFLKLQKKFNKLINSREYNELVRLTEEKVNHRQQFKEKQEYLGYNLLEDIQNSSLGYQIFSKIKEDLDNSQLNKLQKKSQTKDLIQQDLQNNEKSRIYRRRLNQDSFNVLEKSLSPLQKTLPTLGRFNVSNQSNLVSNQVSAQQTQSKLYDHLDSQIDNSNIQFINRGDINTRQKSRQFRKASTPIRDMRQQNSSLLLSGQTTFNLQNSHHSTNRQKKTIEFLRDSRCKTTQGDEIDFFLGQPFIQQNIPSHTQYKQKWNLNRRNKSQISQITQADISQRLVSEQYPLLPTPTNLNVSSQFFSSNQDDYDKMFVVVKNKDAERVKRQLNNSNYGIVRAVELNNMESGNPSQIVIQTQPNEQVEQFEFVSQIDDLKPIVQKRKQILEKITKTIQQQTKQSELGIQMHDQLNIPKYMQIKQQRMQEAREAREASTSQSPKKERKKSENMFVHERSILMKFLKDKQQHEVSVICQDVDTVPTFNNNKKFSVQLGGNNNNSQINQFNDRIDKNQKQIIFSQGASPHNQQPLAKHQNPQLQYFQTKKIDDNVRIVSRGNKSIKYRDNRSPSKKLQIQ